MPGYYGDWQEMPEDTDELADRIMQGYNDGLKAGRQQGAEELADKVNEWVKKRYFDPRVERKTKHAEEILNLARDLIHELSQGELRVVPETKKRKI